MTLEQIVEALLFASDAPLTPADIARAETGVDEAEVRAAIEALGAAYDEDGRAFGVYELAGGFQLLTRPEFVPYLERFATVGRPARLSSAALETLAIIAYRQPVGRAEIEEIRGVGSAAVLRTLAERDLIDVVGRGEGLGRPLLYGTTERFLEHFGFASLDDLPRPEDLPVVLRDGFGLTGTSDASGDDAGEGDEPPDEGSTEDDAQSGERLELAIEAQVRRVVAAAADRPEPVD